VTYADQQPFDTEATMPQHTASCFCGAVELTVSGEPKAQGYCHCQSCRTWSAGPVNAFTLWPTATVKVTRGEDQVGTFNKSPNAFRKFCKRCGGHLMTAHPEWDLIDVYAALLRTHKFAPEVHVHYQETVLPIRDGKPKMRDLPKEMGGSGETLPE
jgi:hypothetical protein